MSYLEKVLTLQNICGAAAAFEGQANLSKLIFTASHNLLLCIVDRKLHLRFFAKWANSSKEFCQGTALFSVLCITLALPGDSRSVRISKVRHQFCDFCLSDFRPWKKNNLIRKNTFNFHFWFKVKGKFDLNSLSHFNYVHPQKLNFVFQGRVQKQQDKTLHFHFSFSHIRKNFPGPRTRARRQNLTLSLSFSYICKNLPGPRTRARKRVRLPEPTWSSHSVASSLLSSIMTRWHESF